MKAGTKFMIGGALVLGTAGFLMAGAIKDTAVYFLTPGELQAKVLEDPGIKGTGVKVGAKVVHGSVVRDPSGKQVTFEMTDLESSAVIWSNDYTFQKAAADDITYQ